MPEISPQVFRMQISSSHQSETSPKQVFLALPFRESLSQEGLFTYRTTDYESAALILSELYIVHSDVILISDQLPPFRRLITTRRPFSHR